MQPDRRLACYRRPWRRMSAVAKYAATNRAKNPAFLTTLARIQTQTPQRGQRPFRLHCQSKIFILQRKICGQPGRRSTTHLVACPLAAQANESMKLTCTKRAFTNTRPMVLVYTLLSPREQEDCAMQYRRLIPVSLPRLSKRYMAPPSLKTPIAGCVRCGPRHRARPVRRPTWKLRSAPIAHRISRVSV